MIWAEKNDVLSTVDRKACSKLTELEAWDLRTLVDHRGATLKGGHGWNWGRAPSKVLQRMESLVKKGLAERFEVSSKSSRWSATDAAHLAVALMNMGRNIRRFVQACEQERRDAVAREKRRAKLVARCEEWLGSMNEGFEFVTPDAPNVTAEGLADFVESVQREGWS